jgi:hypothetical protein
VSRQRNVSWDTLVEVTGANEDFSDGRIAKALQGIRAAAQKEGLVEDEQIALEIRRRAQKYRECFPMCALTPTALASNWIRVMVQPLGAMSQQQLAFQQARMRVDA